MKTKIKSLILLTACNLLMCISGASAQSTAELDFEPDFRQPAGERRTYYAGTVRYIYKGLKGGDGLHMKWQGKFFDKLYIGSYEFPYFPGDGPYIGYQPVKIKLLPGYQAKICKHEKNYTDCETYTDTLEHEYRAFAPVAVDVSRMHLPDTVEIWYGRMPSIVRTFQGRNAIRNPNQDAYLNPNSVWIPAGSWVRMCKAEASDGRVSQCETFTSDTNGKKQPTGTYKFIETGTGAPPTESKLRPILSDPGVVISKTPVRFPGTKSVPKSKPLPKPKKKLSP